MVQNIQRRTDSVNYTDFSFTVHFRANTVFEKYCFIYNNQQEKLNQALTPVFGTVSVT